VLVFGRFWLDFGSILAIFLAVVCNSIHPLASIPASAIPEAEDQVQNLTFTFLAPQSTPRLLRLILLLSLILTLLPQSPRR